MESLLDSCTLFCSEGVMATLRMSDIAEVDYSFQGASYFSVVFAGPVTLPESFLLSTTISGNGKATNLEIKCILKDGKTVWWFIIRDFQYGERATELNIGRGHFAFAWGDAALPFLEIERIEVTLTGGLGHSGTIKVAPIKLATCAVPVEHAEVKSISNKDGALDFNLCQYGQIITLQWRAVGAADLLEVKFFDYALLGGIVLTWAKERIPNSFQVHWLRGDGIWVADDPVEKGGHITCHRWPFGEAAAIKVLILGASLDGSSVLERLELKPPGFGKSWNALYEDRATHSPRGVFPRAFLGEQSFWTVIGAKGGYKKGLINEEGQIELGFNLPSVEPFIRICRGDKDSGLLNWDRCTYSHELVDEYLPLPIVTRRYDEIKLKVCVWAEFSGGAEHLLIDYEVTNLLAEAVQCDLSIAMRPFLVNPPWQDLNVRGGFVPIWELVADAAGMRFRVDEGYFTFEGERRAQSFAASSFWGGDVIADNSGISDSSSVTDTLGHCSGALRYSGMYGPHESRKFGFRLSFGPVRESAPLNRQYLDASFERTRKSWSETLSQFLLDINASPQIGRNFKAQVGYIFTNLFGSWIQPGTRCYRRSWIRDGSLTSSALLRCGYHTEVRSFIEAYASYVSQSGAVPCVVDARGADHTPEYDSQGEFLFLIAEYYRFTGDSQLVKNLWSKVRAVVAEILRLSDLTMSSEEKHCRGLFPPSISHEGYSNKPAFSYWDDFWGIRGLGDAVFLAKSVGVHDEVEWFERAYHKFAMLVIDSMRRSINVHRIDYIPGAADLGDFDPCSTTIGVDPCDVFEGQDRKILEHTFIKYWEFFERRSRTFGGTDSYTPYEWRVVGTLSRLQMKQQAQDAIRFFLSHSRPQGWCHWAEVIWGNQRTPRFIGDAPHGWVGSDYLRSIYSLMIRWEDETIFFGEGVSEEWWISGFSVKLRIPHGWISALCRPALGEAGIDLEVSIDLVWGNYTPLLMLSIPKNLMISWRVSGAEGKLM